MVQWLCQKSYGNDHILVWNAFESLDTEEKVETLFYDFTNTLVGIGSSLGLFLGLSIFDVIMNSLNAVFRYLKTHNKPLCRRNIIVQPIHKAGNKK